MTSTSWTTPAALLVGLLLAAASVLWTAGAARGALERPAYAAGDSWVYVLRGSLAGFPGLNATEGTTSLGLTGLAQVDVVGPAFAMVGGASVSGIQVATHATGFLNGTFVLPGNGTFHASGTFGSDTTEIWEDQADLPVRSNATSSYTIAATLGFPVSFAADLWVNATTEYASLPRFNLSVGESATAPFTADVSAATTVSVFGFSQHNETQTTASGVWTREVLGEENVTVEAGTFPAYRLNQSLGSFPGLGAFVPAGGANETAWFSNGVGSYVKRVAFVNGTPVAEMRLKSYTYPAAPAGLSTVDLALLVGVPIAAIAVLFLVLRRRRKGRGTAGGTAGPVGELPPKPPGGES